MWNAFKVIVFLSIAGYVFHVLWVNGWELGTAKLGVNPPAHVIEKAVDLINHHQTAQAIPLLEYESERGKLWAKIFLADVYEHGKDVPKNTQRAYQIYKELSSSGNADATNEIGIMYYCGQLGPANPKAAQEWFVKAAAAGSREALHNRDLIDKNQVMNCPTQ